MSLQRAKKVEENVKLLGKSLRRAEAELQEMRARAETAEKKANDLLVRSSFQGHVHEQQRQAHVKVKLEVLDAKAAKRQREEELADVQAQLDAMARHTTCGARCASFVTFARPKTSKCSRGSVPCACSPPTHACIAGTACAWCAHHK